MYTSVTILTTRAVHGTKRADCDVVERTEVTSDTTNLLLENLVVEASFEFSLTSRGSGNIHGCLTTTKNDVVLDGSDGGAVEGSICDIGFEDFEVICSDELWREEKIRLARMVDVVDRYKYIAHLGGLVLACGNEVGSVS